MSHPDPNSPRREKKKVPHKRAVEKRNENHDPERVREPSKKEGVHAPVSAKTMAIPELQADDLAFFKKQGSAQKAGTAKKKVDWEKTTVLPELAEEPIAEPENVLSPEQKWEATVPLPSQKIPKKRPSLAASGSQPFWHSWLFWVIAVAVLIFTLWKLF